MENIKRVLLDYEGVMANFPYKESLRLLSRTLYDEARRIDDVKAIRLLVKAAILVPFAKEPLRTATDKAGYRARVMQTLFNFFISSEITNEFLDRFTKDTAKYVRGSTRKIIPILNNMGMEVYVGSTGTPKEIIEEHLRINGLDRRVRKVVANSIDRRTHRLDLRYLDREGKRRILSDACGDSYSDVAIVDDQPHLASDAMNAVQDDGGLAFVVYSHRDNQHDFWKAKDLGDFLNLLRVYHFIPPIPI